jgi:hypothetical protein
LKPGVPDPPGQYFQNAQLGAPISHSKLVFFDYCHCFAAAAKCFQRPHKKRPPPARETEEFNPRN